MATLAFVRYQLAGGDRRVVAFAVLAQRCPHKRPGSPSPSKFGPGPPSESLSEIAMQCDLCGLRTSDTSRVNNWVVCNSCAKSDVLVDALDAQARLDKLRRRFETPTSKR